MIETKTITITKGDITNIEADAIVNAANSSLMGGGGVDGAIHRKGGPVIVEECKEIIKRQGECRTGEAAITTAGNLPAKYVIHTVGPVWRGGNCHEAEMLAHCYLSSLRMASAHHCKSIAFPNISTGVYGYPKEQAARIAYNTISTFMDEHDELEEVKLVCFDDDSYRFLKNIEKETIS